MKEAIQRREIITLDAGGVELRGTHHSSADELSNAPLGRRQDKRIGVLFLNSGFLPRAAYADSAVYWADAFARSGYPSFRCDLPGIGDSEGEVPVQMLDFVHNLNDGHYKALLSACVTHLVEHFDLLGVVVVGLCAGAVSAIYTAAASNGVVGLVVLDPYFNLHRESTNLQRARVYLTGLFSRLKSFDRYTRANQLPKNANLPLLQCWKRLASAGTPILALKARSSEACRNQQSSVEFDYLRYLRVASGGKSRTTVVYVEGANHSFADGLGKTAVERHVVQWLKQYFPLNEDALTNLAQQTIQHRAIIADTGEVAENLGQTLVQD